MAQDAAHPRQVNISVPEHGAKGMATTTSLQKCLQSPGVHLEPKGLQD